MSDRDQFNKWCEKHPALKRHILCVLFGVNVRTMRRYAHGETSIPIAILRMMEIFTRHPNVEKEYLSRFCQ